MPTIRISGVNAGNRVRLYVWDIPGAYTCVTNSGEAVASSSSVDIIISPGLSSGNYLFTAIVDDGAGNNTGCPSVASYPSIPNVLYTYNGPPAAPTALTLITPASSPGRQSLITVRASGVTNGSTVRLFTDSNCSAQIASAAATGTTVNLTTTTDLASGSYTLYSNRTVSGLTSPCSTATVTYQRDTVLTTPSTVTRTSPASSPGIDPWPVITVGGVTSGDTVSLYSDSSCTTLLGSSVASSTTIDLSPDNALSDGTYNFYAKSTYVNTNANASTTTLSSSCSSAHAQYVLDTLISSPTGLTVTSPTVTPSPSVTPIIRVSGVSNGDTVYLFTDSSCTSQIASATSTGTSVDIVTSIPAGDAVWDFYATRINGSYHSNCSTATTQYTADAGATVSIENLISTAMEGSGVQNINVTISTARSYSTTVYFETTYSTATVNTHHNLSSSSVTIAPGATSASISYTPLENADATGDKLLQINLTGTNRATVLLTAKSYHRVAIRDNDISLSQTLKLSTGFYHTCAIITGGILKCWGQNGYYQLGNNLNADSGTPITVDAGTSYADVSAGYRHTCAITTAGVLKCWGNIPSTASTGTPMIIDAGTLYAKVFAGYATTCAITVVTDELKCWGSLSSAGSTSSLITVGTGYQKVAFGTNHVCALQTNGTIYCWGNNTYGQLGDNTNTTRAGLGSPVSGTFSDVSAGKLSTCAITNTGNVACWGFVNFLSGSYEYNVNTPYVLTGTGDFTEISVAPYSSSNTDSKCAIRTNGEVHCLGGFSNQFMAYAETQVGWVNSFIKFFSPASHISLGSGFGCLISQGLSYCFGGNLFGQNGGGYVGSPISYTPQTGPNVVEMTTLTSNNFSCGLDTGGKLLCWGKNTSSTNSFDGSEFDRLYAKIIDIGTTYSSIIANYQSTYSKYFCGITSTSDLKCWGPSNPTNMDSNNTYSQVDIFANNGCAITTGGVLKCWGDNSTTCLVGIGAGQASTNSLVTVDSGTTYATLGHGNPSRSHTCAITTAGAVKCWGRAREGQTGTGVGNSMGVVGPDCSPTNVIDSGTIYTSVTMDYGISCGITNTGILKCWGAGPAIGAGDASDHIIPTVIDSGTQYSKIISYNVTTCGITTPSGVLKCWGYNNTNGLVGQGTTTAYYNSPQVVDAGTSYSDVKIGSDVVCALTVGGVVKCWGNNTYGLVGIGVTNPTAVLTPTIVNAGTTYNKLWISNTHGLSPSICARTNSGITHCWGSNYYNNLGIGQAETLPWNRPVGLE